MASAKRKNVGRSRVHNTKKGGPSLKLRRGRHLKGLRRSTIRYSKDLKEVLRLTSEPKSPLNPVFTMAAARFTLNERITQLKVLAALLVLAGCFLAVKGFEAETLKLNATGLALGLTAALAYAFYTVFGKFLLEKRRLNVESLTLYSIVYAGLSNRQYL